MKKSDSIIKDTFQMAWPAVLESFFVSMAGMIDTVMVSSLGTAAVSSVGLTNQPKFISLSIFTSFNVAVSALVARRRGQGDQKNCNEILATALLYTVVVCALVSTLCVVFSDQIITLCGSNADTHLGGVTYFNIIEGGLIFSTLSLVINSAQRGCGNTKIAMRTNITSSLVNVCFNYLLINGHFGFPALGLKGAALATVLGTVVACIMSLLSISNKDNYISLIYIFKEKIRARLDAFKSITSLSMNILTEQLLMRIGFVYTAVAAAKLGTDPFAVHNVGMNFMNLGFSLGDGMQVASVALVGRSLGEGDPVKARTYASTCQKIGLCISLCYASVLLIFGRTLFSFFFSDPEILDMTYIVSRSIMVIILFQISQVIFGGTLRSAGDVRYCLYSSTFSVAFTRTFVTWLLTAVFHIGLFGIWLGILADQLSRFILLGLRFRKGEWAKIKI